MAKKRPVITVEGVDDLRRDLRRLKDDDLNAAMKEANQVLAKRVIDKALPMVPVLTGRLRSSVRGLGNLSGAIGKAGGARVPYAAAIHWGWPARNIKGTPFLTTAAQSVEQGALVEYEQQVNRVLDRVRGR